MKEKFLGFLKSVRDKLQPVCEKIQFVWGKVKDFFYNVGSCLLPVRRFFLRFKKLILAAPVVLGAAFMAIFTASRLPDYVGIDLQPTGEYAHLVPKFLAVSGPLAVTGLCLLLMFCSKRTLYPWLISLFSLVLPLLILVTNVFPS